MNQQGKSLRSIFKSSRENSLRLEELVGAAPISQTPETRPDTGLDVAMSIRRLLPEVLSRPGNTRSEDDDDGDGATPIDERMVEIIDKVNEVRARHDEEIRRRDLEIDGLRRTNAELERRLGAALEDLDDERTLSEYAKLVGESAPSTIDAEYVNQLQSQLCKALHKMGLMSNQIELLRAEADEKVKSLQTQLVEQGNESFRAEVGYLNDLFEMEKEIRVLKESQDSESAIAVERMTQLEVELEIEKEMRCDVESYTKLRRRKEKRRSSRSADSAGGLAIAAGGLVKEEEEGLGEEEQPSESVGDHEETLVEQDLRRELLAKMRLIEQLQATVADQSQTIAKLSLEEKAESETDQTQTQTSFHQPMESVAETDQSLHQSMKNVAQESGSVPLRNMPERRDSIAKTA